MEATQAKASFYFCFFFLILVQTLQAHIVEWDEVWKQRAKDAHESALAAYDPNPDLVTKHLNSEVHASLARTKSWKHSLAQDIRMSSNTTRRQLLKNSKQKGPCIASNPIDQCWRCKANWANNRKRLADCAIGFGRNTTGGKQGKFYVVTDDRDDDLVNPRNGTLRHAVIQTEPLWIIFARDMNIRLSEELLVYSNKTIDGRGHKVHIAGGAGITLQFVDNVIIHGIYIHNIHSGHGGMIRDSVDHFGQRGRSDGDGISVFGATNIWIDHISMRQCTDGMIDLIEKTTAVTISNCHMTDHDEVMLMSANDKAYYDTIMQVTVAFNHFGKRLVQRMPRCRFGYFHVVNNDYTHWTMYAVGGSQNPTIISQGNRYIAPNIPGAKETTKREDFDKNVWKHWTWRSEGDLLMNGAFFVESGPPDPKAKIADQKSLIKAFSATAVGRLTRSAGALPCKVNRPC
ncbi:hypothetical protein MRB53_002944 [Persea americana]|uniref:Uncharacterized protein n=1 Tax=Persea americana TaxID=3435 RepID=A0ACC2MW60_PERAE|nr:hypothetical protein MRB53_002944 [Persea americana]